MIYGTEKEYIRHTLIKAVVEAGFAEAAPVEEKFMHLYTSWIEEGATPAWTICAATSRSKLTPAMCSKAATVISTAFSYAPAEFRAPALPSIACYAYGSDYHGVFAPEAVAGRRRVQDTPGGSGAYASTPPHSRNATGNLNAE